MSSRTFTSPYQTFTNPPEDTSTIPIQLGEPPSSQQQQKYNPFASKAQLTRKIGILQVIYGIGVIVMGFLMLILSPKYWASLASGGLWSGLSLVVAGALCISAGSNPERNSKRRKAFISCIISLFLVGSCGLMNFVAFMLQFDCQTHCYDDVDNGYSHVRCDSYCDKIGRIFSLVLAIIMLMMFVFTFISTMNTGRDRSFSSRRNTQGYVISKQQPAGTGNQGSEGHHQQSSGYQPPISVRQSDANPYPGYSQHYHGTTAASPQNDEACEKSQKEKCIPGQALEDMSVPSYNPNH